MSKWITVKIRKEIVDEIKKMLSKQKLPYYRSPTNFIERAVIEKLKKGDSFDN